jgi:hypothetical protein
VYANLLGVLSVFGSRDQSSLSCPALSRSLSPACWPAVALLSSCHRARSSFLLVSLSWPSAPCFPCCRIAPMLSVYCQSVCCSVLVLSVCCSPWSAGLSVCCCSVLSCWSAPLSAVAVCVLLELVCLSVLLSSAVAVLVLVCVSLCCLLATLLVRLCYPCWSVCVLLLLYSLLPIPSLQQRGLRLSTL